MSARSSTSAKSWEHLPHEERANVYFRLGMAAGERVREAQGNPEDSIERAYATADALFLAGRALQEIPYVPPPDEGEGGGAPHE